MGLWKSEDAEKRFSEVMHLALTDSVQIVLGADQTAVVVLSEKDHHRLVLAHQRLLELGETPPEPRGLGEGEQNAWEFILGLPPVDEFGGPGFPDGYFERMREDSRHCECCADRAASARAAEAADSLACATFSTPT